MQGGGGKRSFKLQEFAAHAGTVNCLKVGRKSSGVLVTGGDDCKVNMWAIGKPQAIYSLAGRGRTEGLQGDCLRCSVLRPGTAAQRETKSQRVDRPLTKR
jgi:hypothetical protein